MEYFVKLSILLISLNLIISNVTSQKVSNKINQNTSKNANVQLGNNNINKPILNDKRVTNNNTDKSTNLYGDINPYTLIVNNNYGSVDSIRQDIILRKKRIRIGLAIHMFELSIFEQRCKTDTSSSKFIKLYEEFQSWKTKVIDFLDRNLDQSYSTQFELVRKSHVQIVEGITERTSGLFQTIVAKFEKLDSFVTSLY
jgi:hypothetical protein